MTPDTDKASPGPHPTDTAGGKEGAVIIYHSETDHTRAIARKAAKLIGAALIEVRPKYPYCRLGKYLRGGEMAAFGLKEAITPAEIDISPYSVIIVGTPVWSQHPTPVINRAVTVLEGAREGCEAIVFATCLLHAGKATTPVREALGQAGIPARKSYVFPNRAPVADCAQALAGGVEALRIERKP
ncbi:MAG TPA: ArsR family transcriptional regulator [Methanoculleus sp.]|nr:ArsR family transcriptional regulator [Methanoculleus sp.]